METVKTQDVSLNDLPWIVDYSPERCTLCGSCVATCTFDAITFARERINSAARKSGSEESKGPATRLVVRQSAAVAQACTGCGMCDKVCVMYAGRIVESALTDELYENPTHPYTQGLIASVPKMDGKKEERLFSIEGQPPNVIDLPPCCPFHPRCHKVCDVCQHAYPPVKQVGDDHYVACWLACSEEERQAALKGGEI